MMNSKFNFFEKSIHSKRLRICLIIGVFAIGWLTFCGCGKNNAKEAQEWYETGMQNYYFYNFKEAAKWLEKSADAGNVKAQEMLGYKKGLFITRKPDTSHISFETILQWKAHYEEKY